LYILDRDDFNINNSSNTDSADDNYVDKNSYTWRNLALFTHYQALLWTRDGAIKRSYTK